jgi:LuxR family transcriptional regulator, maltose regulon positive regulatory protein
VVAVGRARVLALERRSLVPALRDAGAKPVLAGWEDQLDGLEIVESKLRIPEPLPTSVSRTALVNRLRAAGAFPVVLVVAPAGYGKTTLLAQWAARDVRQFAWISLDERDNDPTILLRHIAAALDRVLPLSQALADAVCDLHGSVWDAAMPRLTEHLASLTRPFVLSLDNADLLDSKESLAAVSALIENVPVGSMVALSGRATPKLPVPALRVGGPLLEIGPYELGLSRREAELLLRSCAVELREDQLLELLEQTEGWAAGIYLAALAAREAANGDGLPLQVAGDDRYLADYFRSEYLSRLTPDLLAFLRRTSVLEKVCAPLCDALLDSTNSALQLEAIEKANVFIVALDRNREWFRYHPLFRDLLRRELEEHEPDRVRVLNDRAAAWYEAHADPESALRHAREAGDDDAAARILTSIALDLRHRGRLAAVEESLEHFDDDERLDRYPAVAVLGCSIHALRGRAEQAGRWLGAATRGSAPRRRGMALARLWIAAMRSTMCTDGPEQMQIDARSAVAKLPKDDAWRPVALLAHGAAALVLGDTERAESRMAEAAEESERLGCAETRAVAMAELSLLAAARDDHRRAEALALEAYELVEASELGDYATSALSFAASARALLRRGQWDKARRHLTAAERLMPSLTYVIPWLAIQARLELGSAYVTLRDREGARRVLEGADDILSARRELGTLVSALRAFEHEVAAMEAETGVGGLTPAELRLLPLLSTHLSFREIGERLYVSRNTIKTQAISVYRKLGVSSRSEAIVCAGDLGLVSAGAAPGRALPLRAEERPAAGVRPAAS